MFSWLAGFENKSGFLILPIKFPLLFSLFLLSVPRLSLLLCSLLLLFQSQWISLLSCCYCPCSNGYCSVELLLLLSQLLLSLLLMTLFLLLYPWQLHHIYCTPVALLVDSFMQVWLRTHKYFVVGQLGLWIWTWCNGRYCERLSCLLPPRLVSERVCIVSTGVPQSCFFNTDKCKASSHLSWFMVDVFVYCHKACNARYVQSIKMWKMRHTCIHTT